jgi:hypothetical protein
MAKMDTLHSGTRWIIEGAQEDLGWTHPEDLQA